MIKKAFAALLMLITVIVGMVSVAARLGAWHWRADLFALVPDLYALVALLLLGGFVLLRRWRWAGAAALLLLFNGWLLLGYVPTAARAQAAGEPDLRLLMYNIYFRNDDTDAILAEIEKHDADVVFLMEYSYQIQQAIEPPLAEAYPYRLIEPSRGTTGLALFSRLPLADVAVHRSPETHIPIIEATIPVAGRPVSFVGGHPWPPLGSGGFLNQAQTAAIADVAAQAGDPLIVAGDFNASPWSFAVRNVMAAGDVRDTRLGFGLEKTWRWRRSPSVALPIDHVLVSEAWSVLDYFHGAPGRSDHVPMIIDLQLLPD